MRGDQFLNSKWIRMAREPGAARDLGRKLTVWLKKVKDTRLVEKARKLWEHLRSPATPAAEKVILIAALLYLITPIDVVPDWIPVAGLLDDLGVATFALNYLRKKVRGDEEIKGTEPREQ